MHPRRLCHRAASGRGHSGTKVEEAAACRWRGGRRIMARANKEDESNTGTTPARRPPPGPKARDAGGPSDVGEGLRRTTGVEEARLYRRREIPGDVRAVAQRPEWVLGRAGQARALV